MRGKWKSVVLVAALALVLTLAGCGRAPAANEGAPGGAPPSGTAGKTGADNPEAPVSSSGGDGGVVAPPAGAPTGGDNEGAVPPAKLQLGPVQLVHRVDAASGWMLRETRVLKTGDGGHKWVEVTPPGLNGARLSAAAFLDARSSWVAAIKAGTPETLTVWRTTDGGQNWHSARVGAPDDRKGPASGARLAFTDARHGWLLASHGVAAGSNWVEVFTSSDGGASWQLAVSTDPQQQKPDRLPLGGLKTGIGALDAKTAWVTGFDYGDQIWLYRTPDAGKTWQRQAVTAPAGYHTEGGAVETRPPVFFGQDGFLPVLFHQEGQPTIFYVTHDDGATWRPTAPVKSAGNSSFVWSFIDSRHGFATDGKKFYTTADGAQSWQTVTMNKELANVSQLAFVSTEAGWAVADGTLWATQDGGRTWTLLT